MPPKAAEQVGYVLDFDPDLGVGIAHADWERARTACRARLRWLEPGRCDLATAADGETPILAFVIVSGMLAREVRIRARHSIELLGRCDVLPPPCSEPPHLGQGPVITALSRTLVLELGRRFIRCASSWPSLLAELLERRERQDVRQRVQEVILHFSRAEHRLLLMLWHLAHHWGRVTTSGVHLPLRLTHDLLGHLTASERSTTTLAVRELTRTRAIQRLGDGTWLVTPAGQRRAEAMAISDGERWMGGMILLRDGAGEVLGRDPALTADAEPTRGRRGSR